MKNRSHRIPVLPFEDWGDGSWTVDCPCGVTFDDGEEMVDCDECGVWVHTRCSGYDKERESFTCVKCEGKKRRRPFSFADRGTDSVASASNNEEAEVAELLAELPTKADPCPTLAYRQPAFQLLKALPMEERVHVNGVPGGDPVFFDGLSSVFSPELWKCTGYVPKKLNFKYKEFPCWEDDENENPANTGADVLFSLSKETATYTTKKTSERRSSSKIDRRSDVKSIFNNATRTSVKKERNKLRGPGAFSGKKREEELFRSKDRSAKKNLKSCDKSSQLMKHKVGTARIMNTCTLKSHEDGLTQGSKSVVQDVKNEDKKVGTTLEPADISTYPQGNDIGDNLVQNSIGVSSNVTFKYKLEPGLAVKAARVDQQSSLDANILPHTEDPALLAKGAYCATEVSIKEDVGTNLDGLKQLNDKSDYGKLSGSSSSVAVEPEKPSHTKEELGSITPDIQNHGTQRASDTASSLGPEEVKHEEETITINNETTGRMVLPHPLVNGKQSHEDLQNHKLTSSLAFDMDKPRDAENVPISTRQHLVDNNFEGVNLVSPESEKVECGQEKLGGAVAMQDDLSSSKNNPKFAEESPKLMTSPTNPVIVHKLALAVGKASPMSEHDPPRLSVNGSYKSPGTTSSSSSAKVAPFAKRLKADKANNSKKDNAMCCTSDEEGVQVRSARQTIKTHPKGSSSGCKLSQSSVIIQTSSYKHKISDSKANPVHPSSKTSSADNSTGSSGPGRPGPSSSSQAKNLLVQVKLAASSSCAKNERTTSTSSQSHKKMINHSSTVLHPSSVNVSTTLTDEELAKRLHQELNSSPRVSRVPRGVRAGMSQFAPPTAASMLSKRPSNCGGKVPVMVSRKKNKGDTYRDCPRGTSQVSLEAQKEHLSFSAHKKHQNQALPDSSANRDVHKRIPDATPCRRSVQQSSSAGDDLGAAFRTLPGLIDEIMSKGRRITYDELCDAVLPHWKKLRKPNGERYAYSSHSLAVLDCLRNRNEWAHLIDRGPKTSSTRKRSVLDADTSIEESDDGIVKIMGVRDKKEHSSREDFPKGKRKARKRRRLALQGKDLKALRKGEKLKTVSDDDFSSFSLSDDEENQDLSSDDEVQRSKRRAVSSDTTSSSSDDSD